MKFATLLKEIRTSNKLLEGIKGKLGNIQFDVRKLNEKHTTNTLWTTIAGICGIIAIIIAVFSMLIATKAFGEDTPAALEEAGLIGNPLEESSTGISHFYIRADLLSSLHWKVESNSPKIITAYSLREAETDSTPNNNSYFL